MDKCIQITISGGIYGQGLRSGATHAAFSQHIKGFVEYTRAGELFIEAEGKAESLERFTDWCRVISLPLQSSCMNILEAEVKGYPTFEMRLGNSERITPPSTRNTLINLFRNVLLTFRTSKTKIS